MEEILASIRRIIEDSDTARQPSEDDAAHPGDGVPGEVEAFRAELEAPAQPVSMAEIHASVQQDPEEVSTPTAEIHPLHAEPEAAEEYTARDDDVHDAVEAAAAPAAAAEQHSEPLEADHAETRPAIISDQAGRQVAAAFGELSEVFAASRRRSFDEMAEEMLRPMLQDWLDNNLPTLVERLVREEIERVARGG